MTIFGLPPKSQLKEVPIIFLLSLFGVKLKPIFGLIIPLHIVLDNVLDGSIVYRIPQHNFLKIWWRQISHSKGSLRCFFTTLFFQ